MADHSVEEKAAVTDPSLQEVSQPKAPRWLRILAVVAALFGVLTLISGGRVLFGPPEAQAAAGAYVPFVLWFNTIMGLVYVLAAGAMWFGRPWACGLAAFIAGATLFVFVLFGIAIMGGTPYEMRTVGAMTLRSGFWLITAFALWRWRRSLG